MDNADRAQADSEREDARREARRLTDAAPKISAHRCRDCCEEIPQARRQAAPGCVRCASCAVDYEKETRR